MSSWADQMEELDRAQKEKPKAPRSTSSWADVPVEQVSYPDPELPALPERLQHSGGAAGRSPNLGPTASAGAGRADGGRWRRDGPVGSVSVQQRPPQRSHASSGKPPGDIRYAQGRSPSQHQHQHHAGHSAQPAPPAQPVQVKQRQQPARDAPAAVAVPAHTVQERRETGVVSSLRTAEGYGFVKCAEREADLFFSLQSILDSKPPGRGDEVEFDVVTETATGKVYAQRVEILPKGTVVFEEVLPDRRLGVVERQLQGTSTRGPRGAAVEPFGGKVRETGPADAAADTKEAASGDLYEFALRDLMNSRYRPELGDHVEFSVFVEKRSGRRGATKVKLVRPNPAGRTQGVVVTFKSDYGFIRTAGTNKQMFFHISGLLDDTPGVADTVRPGTEFEFNYTEESDGRFRCSRLVILPKGTVKAEEAPAEPLRGTILSLPTENSFRQGHGGKGGGSRGVVVVQSADDEASADSEEKSKDKRSGKDQRFNFKLADLRDSRQTLLVGDEVEFKVVRNLLTHKSRVSDLHIVTPSKAGREKGVISAMKGDFGFIDCEQREKSMFFHVSQMAEQTRAQVGVECEFNVSTDPSGKTSAIRITALPSGSVKFAEVEPQKYRGVVERVLKRRRAGNKDKNSFFSKKKDHRDKDRSNSIGELGLVRALDMPGVAGPDASQDASAASAAAAPDKDKDKDKDKRKGRGRGKKSGAPQSEAATAPSEKEDEERKASSDNAFSYGADDVSGTSSLMVGDEVEFQLVVNRATKKKSATNLRLIKPGGDRSRGIVSALKAEKGFGFIVREDAGEEPLFFHVNEVVQASTAAPSRSKPRGRGTSHVPAPNGAQNLISIGDCVEFNVGTDPTRNKPVATRVTTLPKGSVKPPKPSLELSGVLGVVIADGRRSNQTNWKRGRGGHGGRSDAGSKGDVNEGVISLLSALQAKSDANDSSVSEKSEAKQEAKQVETPASELSEADLPRTLQFNALCVRQKSSILRKGDLVRFRAQAHTATATPSTKWTLADIELCETRGVVDSVRTGKKGSSGVIKTTAMPHHELMGVAFEDETCSFAMGEFLGELEKKDAVLAALAEVRSRKAERLSAKGKRDRDRRGKKSSSEVDASQAAAAEEDVGDVKATEDKSERSDAEHADADADADADAQETDTETDTDAQTQKDGSQEKTADVRAIELGELERGDIVEFSYGPRRCARQVFRVSKGSKDYSKKSEAELQEDAAGARKALQLKRGSKQRSVQKMRMAKGPDGSGKGFAAGRGRVAGVGTGLLNTSATTVAVQMDDAYERTSDILTKQTGKGVSTGNAFDALMNAED